MLHEPVYEVQWRRLARICSKATVGAASVIITPAVVEEMAEENLKSLLPLGLHPKAYFCLSRGGYTTVDQVEMAEDHKLLEMRNLGKGMLSNIRAVCRLWRGQ